MRAISFPPSSMVLGIGPSSGVGRIPILGLCIQSLTKEATASSASYSVKRHGQLLDRWKEHLSRSP